MSDDVDDLEREELEAEIREINQRLRRLDVEKRCLEYVQFRIDREKAVEDTPTFYPSVDPLRN